jgi:predicted O-linked N-acetylglucosamine transferase (SPINDLY family)
MHQLTMASTTQALSDAPSQGLAPTLDQACSNAMNLQLAGRLDLAEPLYRAVLQAEPQHAAANYCVGMLNVQLRRPAEGLAFLRVALESNPKIPDYWLGYLEALLLSGRTEEAQATLALARRHGLAGDAAEDFAKRLEAASTPTAEPSPEPARAVSSESAGLAQDQEAALLAAMQQGDSIAALAQARGMTERFPERGLPWKVLGALFWAESRTDEALAAMKNSVRLMPQDAEAHSNLGLSLAKLQRFAEAEAWLRKALDIDPKFATAHYRLGMTYFMQARLPEAEAKLRLGISLRADYAAGDDELNYSNLLFIVSHDAAVDADSLFAEHCRFGEYFEDRASWPTHLNSRDPDRRLKVGFVSGDLRAHAIANFVEPLLAQLHDHPGLQLHAYYNNPTEDVVSRRLQTYFNDWLPIFALSDTQLAQRVMEDGIDILIDLSGHTALNRLPAFARKPAPIQVSWLGYPGTTGLCAMDYYLADRHFLPPGQFDRHFTEKLAYFDAFAPFQPYAAAPPVNALPALSTGSLRFASFNRLSKINDSTIALWSQLLHALPATHMMLAGITLEDGQERLIARFATHGITRERLTFQSHCKMEEYLALHTQVDICLDTTPYTGGTTTSHALWMGVPTLTIAGPTPAARQGASIQELVGVDGFSATSPADFIAKGLYWSEHLAALAELRAGLRARWQQAPGREPRIIATSLEHSLRHMWRRWCAGMPAESFSTPAAAATQVVPPASPPKRIKSPKSARANRRSDALFVRKQESAMLSMVERREFAAALALARTMTQRFPERGLGWKVLGAFISTEDSQEDAVAAMEKAVQLMPRDAEAHVNLGLTLAKLKRFAEAEAYLRKALDIKPDFAAAHYRLGMTYEFQGRFADAEASIRRGMALRTGLAEGDDELYYSNLLFLVSHSSALNADALFAEHCRFGEYFEARLRGSWPKHPNDRNPERRLKVGFVSGDLYNHAVSGFIEPLLEQLSGHPGLELYAYYNNIREDEVSRRMRGYFKGWYPVSAQSNIQLAKKIMDDQIDILIDLSGHTGFNRLPTFARKPAPIQVSWLGYPGTTGLSAMDYYLADRHFLPPGQFDRHFTEKLVYFDAFAPFQPYAAAPPVNALPALSTGSLRFASFNRLGKINESTIALWSQLLHALPATHMMLAGITLDDGQERLLAQFATHGIARERLTFRPRCNMDEYLALHHQVDICLDTTPYTGGTTTSHALWMGVPTLTIAGPTPAARQGASIQELVGVDGFSATSPADFIAKGLYWSEHLAALAELRAGLRARWQQAPGREPRIIATSLEHSLRHMWRRWCAGLPAESFEVAAPKLEN